MKSQQFLSQWLLRRSSLFFVTFMLVSTLTGLAQPHVHASIHANDAALNANESKTKQKNVYMVDYDFTVNKLDGLSGKKIWSYTIPSELTTGVYQVETQYQNNVLYVQISTNNLIALNATNGNELWRFNREDGYYIDHLLFDDNSVYILLSTNFEGHTVSEFRALNTQDGSERWRLSRFKPVYRAFLINGTIYSQIGNPARGVETSVYTFNAQTGQPGWSLHKFTPAPQFFAARNGILYGSYGEYLTALDEITGTVLWQNTLPVGYSWTTPRFANNLLYLTTAPTFSSIPEDFENMQVVALNPHTGKTAWKSATGYTLLSHTNAISADDKPNDSLLVNHLTIEKLGIASINSTTGAAQWETTTCEGYDCKQLWEGVVRSKFYQFQLPIGNSDAATLLSFNANTGKHLTNQQTSVVIDPLYSLGEGNGDLYVHSYDATDPSSFHQYLIQSINLKDGQVAWTYKMQPDNQYSPPLSYPIVAK
jgi:outer membrane protein assembly factor BamB